MTSTSATKSTPATGSRRKCRPAHQERPDAGCHELEAGAVLSHLLPALVTHQHLGGLVRHRPPRVLATADRQAPDRRLQGNGNPLQPAMRLARSRRGMSAMRRAARREALGRPTSLDVLGRSAVPGALDALQAAVGVSPLTVAGDGWSALDAPGCGSMTLRRPRPGSPIWTCYWTTLCPATCWWSATSRDWAAPCPSCSPSPPTSGLAVRCEVNPRSVIAESPRGRRPPPAAPPGWRSGRPCPPAAR